MVKAVENKTKNPEQALRKEAATPKEEDNDQDSGLIQRIELEWIVSEDRVATAVGTNHGKCLADVQAGSDEV